MTEEPEKIEQAELSSFGGKIGAVDLDFGQFASSWDPTMVSGASLGCMPYWTPTPHPFYLWPPPAWDGYGYGFEQVGLQPYHKFLDSLNQTVGVDLWHEYMAAKNEAVSTKDFGDCRKAFEEKKQDVRAKLASIELRSEHVPLTLQLAYDDIGSLFLQEALTPDLQQELWNQVLQTLLPDIQNLSKDANGRTVVERLLAPTPKNPELVDKLLEVIPELAGNNEGCRIAQIIIRAGTKAQFLRIAEVLRPTVEKLIVDKNGNHVIQACIEVMPTSCVSFIVTAVEGRIQGIAKNMFGCRVVQRLIENVPQLIENVVNGIHEHTLYLANTKYGNYVLSHLLEHGTLEDKRKIIRTVIDNIEEGIADLKFSSRIVEACLKCLAEEDGLGKEREQLVEALLRPELLHKLMQSKFGHFVVKKFISSVFETRPGEEQEKVRKLLRNAPPEVLSGELGVKVLATLQSAEGKLEA